MKKDSNTPKLKLNLNRVSLRPLQGEALSTVAGGVPVDPSVRVAGCNLMSNVGTCF